MMPAVPHTEPKVPAELVMLSFAASIFLGLSLYAWV
jgi:hypothetical protein